MQLIKRILAIALPLLVVATVINDAGHLLTAHYELSTVSQSAADASADVVRRNNNDRDASWRAGESVAQEIGATVYGYEITDSQVNVWTRRTVRSTWVLHYLSAYISRDPWETPLTIEDEASSLIR